MISIAKLILVNKQTNHIGDYILSSCFSFKKNPAYDIMCSDHTLGKYACCKTYARTN